MQGKRGQGLSVNAIILIILGVVVLALLIFGFTVGFKGLTDKIAPSNNVNAVVTSCSAACSTNDIYEFCSLEKTLKADDLPSGGDEVMETCNFFAKDSDFVRYGIKECPALADEDACKNA